MSRTTVRSASGAAEHDVALATGAMTGGVCLPEHAGPGYATPHFGRPRLDGWPRLASVAREEPARFVPWLLGLAFVARFVVRLRGGETDLLTNSYAFYTTLSASWLNGTGLCLSPGQACAFRLPVYPIFLSPWLAAGWIFPGLAIAQAAVGAALVWVAWRIGRDLFDERTGLLAAVLSALSPYALVHDTAIQDTVLVNFLIALAIYLLWQTRRRGAPAACLGAGVVLGLVALTTARLTLVLPAAIAWAIVGAGPTARIRARSALLVALPVALLLGGWVARNWRVVGAPVLTTEAGESLWVANNSWAMAHFPAESIDLSLADSYTGMTAAEQVAFARVSDDEVVRDRLLRSWALEYITTHPGLTIRNGAYKIWVVVSAQLSPARGAVLEWGYALVFLPVHLLAAIALWQHRRAWRVHALAGAVLVSFAITTAAFWAHTSHKSCLDVLLFVYAAAAIGHRPAREAS
jgi:4-amino-4-deoxy-L-arabinose transferase-like glycosyltransferase